MGKTMLVGAAAALLVGGCYVGGSDWGSGSSRGAGTWEDGRTATPDEGWGDTTYGETELVVVDAHLSGTLGPAEGFSEEPYRVTAYRDGELDVIRVDATDSATGRWVMAEIHVQGGLDHPSFVEGETLSFVSEEAGAPVPSGAVFVSGLGCSGPAEMEFEYDEPTQGAEAEVLAGTLPGQRIFDFHLTFPDGRSAADLRVEVELPGAPGPTGATVREAYLDGSLDGVAVAGASTWLDQIHSSAHSTVTLEQETPAGDVLRVRVDIEGGLGALDPGTLLLDPAGDVITLVASTTPFDVDPSYDRRPVALESHASATATGRELVLVAVFEGGQELVTTLRY